MLRKQTLHFPNACKAHYQRPADINEMLNQKTAVYQTMFPLSPRLINAFSERTHLDNMRSNGEPTADPYNSEFQHSVFNSHNVQH
jgi:hypothetical protein